ncbi:zinc finger protein 518B [Pelobates fuscus]|uniref:zinc finger protein 518B n=1 Tax=Pelobates fuscus TaxID=191477 RepID=UPI002FE4D2DE
MMNHSSQMQMIAKFNCEKCRFSTKDPLKYNNHVSLHKDIKFSCSHCNYVCYTKGEFQRHLVTHTGKFPYTCEYCGYGAVRNDYIVKHIKRIHNDGKIQCSVSIAENDAKNTSVNIIQTQLPNSIIDVSSNVTLNTAEDIIDLTCDVENVPSYPIALNASTETCESQVEVEVISPTEGLLYPWMTLTVVAPSTFQVPPNCFAQVVEVRSVGSTCHLILNCSGELDSGSSEGYSDKEVSFEDKKPVYSADVLLTPDKHVEQPTLCLLQDGSSIQSLKRIPISDLNTTAEPTLYTDSTFQSKAEISENKQNLSGYFPQQNIENTNTFFEGPFISSVFSLSSGSKNILEGIQWESTPVTNPGKTPPKNSIEPMTFSQFSENNENKLLSASTTTAFSYNVGKSKDAELQNYVPSDIGEKGNELLSVLATTTKDAQLQNCVQHEIEEKENELLSTLATSAYLSNVEKPKVAQLQKYVQSVIGENENDILSASATTSFSYNVEKTKDAQLRNDVPSEIGEKGNELLSVLASSKKDAQLQIGEKENELLSTLATSAYSYNVEELKVAQLQKYVQSAIGENKNELLSASATTAFRYNVEKTKDAQLRNDVPSEIGEKGNELLSVLASSKKDAQLQIGEKENELLSTLATSAYSYNVEELKVAQLQKYVQSAIGENKNELLSASATTAFRYNVEKTKDAQLGNDVPSEIGEKGNELLSVLASSKKDAQLQNCVKHEIGEKENELLSTLATSAYSYNVEELKVVQLQKYVQSAMGENKNELLSASATTAFSYNVKKIKDAQLENDVPSERGENKNELSSGLATTAFSYNMKKTKDAQLQNHVPSERGENKNELLSGSATTASIYNVERTKDALQKFVQSEVGESTEKACLDQSGREKLCTSLETSPPLGKSGNKNPVNQSSVLPPNKRKKIQKSKAHNKKETNFCTKPQTLFLSCNKNVVMQPLTCVMQHGHKLAPNTTPALKTSIDVTKSSKQEETVDQNVKLRQELRVLSTRSSPPEKISSKIVRKQGCKKLNSSIKPKGKSLPKRLVTFSKRTFLQRSKSLRLLPALSNQPTQIPSYNQPVVVLNHPDVDSLETFSIMKIVRKFKSNVLSVTLSKTTCQQFV